MNLLAWAEAPPVFASCDFCGRAASAGCAGRFAGAVGFGYEDESAAGMAECLMQKKAGRTEAVFNLLETDPQKKGAA